MRMIYLIKNNKALFFIVLITFFYGIFFSLRINFNSLYLDESDYLFVSKNIFSHNIWNTKSYIFSSDIPFYFLGLGEYLGGVIGARFVNQIFNLITIYLFFNYVKKIYSKEIGYLSSLILFSQSNFIFIGKFATYDSISFMLLNACIYFSVKIIIEDKIKYSNYFFASLFIVLSILCKYIVIIYLPIFIILILYKKDVFGTIYSLLPMISLFFYFYYYKDDILMLYETQVLGVHLNSSSYLEILKEIIYYSSDKIICLLVMFYLIGNIIRDENRIKAKYFIFMSLTIIFYHLSSLDYISLYKHINYFIIFIIPVVSNYLYLAINYSSRKNYIIANIFMLIFLLSSLHQIQNMENSYPNTDNLLPLLKDISNKSIILSEDPYLFRYYLFDRIDPFNVSELNSDPESKILNKIKTKKFDYIYLTGLINPILSERIKIVAIKNNYRMYFSEDYKISKTISNIDSGKIIFLKK